MPSPTTGASSWATMILEQTWAGSAAAGGQQDLAFVNSNVRPAGEQFPADPSLGGMAPKDPLTKLKRSEGDEAYAVRYVGFSNLWHSFFGAIYDESMVGTALTYERFYYPHYAFNEYDKAGSITAGYRSLLVDTVVPDGTKYGYRRAGALITAMRFAIRNEALLITPSWLTQKPSALTGDPGAASFPTAPLVLGGTQATVTLADRGSAGSTFLINDGEVSIEIPKSNDREHVGSFDMKEPLLNGDMTIQITMNRENLNTLLVEDWSNDQAKELSIKWVSPTEIEAGYNYELELYFPHLLLSDTGPDISDNGVNAEAITLTGYWDADTAGRGALDVATTQRATNMWLRERNTVTSVPIIT